MAFIAMIAAPSPTEKHGGFEPPASCATKWSASAGESDNTPMTSSFTRTLRFKVRPESYGWLSAAAVEVNQVFNFCNETSLLAATRTDLKRKWLTGFDLCHLTSGSAQYFERIGADTIQRICVEYAPKRSAAKRRRLRWRVSRGARRSLGKGEYAGRSVEVVSETNTTRTCSICGALLGPKGMDMLVVRYWECPECGAGHDRDQNAARNILCRA
jgi:hypothetical protein